MKCDMIKDLLPLYADKLTSKESNQEIEKHLKECKECRRCYQEMTGELPEILPKAQVKEGEFLKKAKKKRRIFIGAMGLSFLFAGIGLCLLFLTPCQVNSEDVELTYGRVGDRVYCEMQAKGNRDICFTGYGGKKILGEDGERIGSEGYLKVLTEITSTQGSKSGWEDVLDKEENQIVRWTFEFGDKIIVIENGELVSEKEK